MMGGRGGGGQKQTNKNRAGETERKKNSSRDFSIGKIISCVMGHISKGVRKNFLNVNVADIGAKTAF